MAVEDTQMSAPYPHNAVGLDEAEHRSGTCTRDVRCHPLILRESSIGTRCCNFAHGAEQGEA